MAVVGTAADCLLSPMVVRVETEIDCLVSLPVGAVGARVVRVVLSAEETGSTGTGTDGLVVTVTDG